MDAIDVHGCVHMTGGGFPDNIPRVVPSSCDTLVDKSSWEVPEVMRWVQEKGKIAESEMFRTFNMGVGMIFTVDPADVDAALATVPSLFVLGEIVEGSGTVQYK
jgi:phosphoribosylformylglycinamidine cyclo-ligase